MNNVEWASATCDILTSNWQLGPVDLSVDCSHTSMPDVQLDALCDIIFAGIEVPFEVPRRNVKPER